MPKTKVSQVPQQSSICRSKSPSAKQVDSSITSMPYVTSRYSTKPSVSAEIPDRLAASNVTKNVPEFIHDLKSDQSFAVVMQ
ncbi:hypothetical protein ACTXT7_012691 [Hymenolepis weldensis]